MSEQVKFHIVHDRINNPGYYCIAREAAVVHYWSDRDNEWVIHPGGTLYPSKRMAERRLEELVKATISADPTAR